MYKKVNTKIGDRMIGTDELGRLTYTGVRDFICSTPGIVVKTICDSPNVYRAEVSCAQIPYSIEEIGEAETATQAYELAIMKAFKRLMDIDLPLCNEMMEEDNSTEINLTNTAKDVKTGDAASENETNSSSFTAESQEVDKTDKTDKTEIPSQPEASIESEPEENVMVSNDAELSDLEQTIISIGQKLSKNPKTIKELMDEEQNAPNMGMIGFIARKVKNGPNIEQANKVRKYLDLKGITY